MDPRQRLQVEIRVHGVLGAQWGAWLDDFEVGPEPEGNTLLAGSLPDQAALHGVLAKLRDMGLSILMVNVMDANKEESSGEE